MQQKLPLLTPENEAFWTGGAQGSLMISYCNACQNFFHPPAPICPDCGQQHIEPKPVSGKGHVVSFTVNHQPWAKEIEVPYVIAIIELAERQGLRLVSNIINIDPEEVYIDMPVSVTFKNIEDVWLPLFEKSQS